MNQEIRKALLRFKDKIKVDPLTGCWLWQGSKDQKGYGLFGFGGSGRNVRAHRWLYETLRGPIPEGFECSHVCHRRSCVRIDHRHVIVETHAENCRRSAALGRYAESKRGEKNYCAILSDEGVKILRTLWAEDKEIFPARRLAELYGVSVYTIYNVLGRHTFKHI
jgi:hypothetical protein